MTKLLLELQDRKWSQVPRINELRLAVAEDVLTFLKERLQEGSVDPDIQRETGWSYTLMGHVYRAQGDIEKATGYYDKAISVIATLVEENPHVVSNRLELALAYHNRGLHYQYSGDKQHARELFQKAADNYARSIEDFPGVFITYECPYVRALNNYAWFLATCPQIEFRDPVKSIKLAENATAVAPEQAEYWNTLGVARYRGRQWTEAACTPWSVHAIWAAAATPSTFSSWRWPIISWGKPHRRKRFIGKPSKIRRGELP